MTGLFSPAVPKPTPRPEAPAREDPAVLAAARQQKIRAAKAQGTTSTILAGTLSQAAPGVPKRLLGS